MANLSDINFIEKIDDTTGDRTFLIRFDFGTRHIYVTEGTRINLDYLHGGFKEAFTRKGYDLIIGDDWHYALIQPLGVGYGKEVWSVTPNDKYGYDIIVCKFTWKGSNYGYDIKPSTVQMITMSSGELAAFEAKHGVSVHDGLNTLYTTWAVLPNPEIHYHMEDHGFYAPADGKIILHDYFRYGENTVFVGDKLLSDIIKSSGQIYFMGNPDSNKSQTLKDTFLSETISGGKKADKISSLKADDVIIGGGGDDTITLGSGDKTVVINKGDGRDVIKNFYKSDSLTLQLNEVEGVSYSKSGNNLVLTREYDDCAEETVVADYFKYWTKQNQIIVTDGKTSFTDDLTRDFETGESKVRILTSSTTVKGTDLSDEAYSTKKNETFSLGKGYDEIKFSNPDGLSWAPYEFGKDTVKLTSGSHVVLDMDHVGGLGGYFTYEKSGNDAVITVRNRVEICGRENGKEEWDIKRLANGKIWVSKTMYRFTGLGYEPTGETSKVLWTESDYIRFTREKGVSLRFGKNTLYTSWAVVPNPEIHYSMTDTATYDRFLGSVTLKDYFKYSEDSVYLGDTSLQQIFKDLGIENTIDKSRAKKGQTINDTFMDDTIVGSKKSDTIYSMYADDTITAGKGDDRIVLGDGNKVINTVKGDGNDTLIISRDTDRTSLFFNDVDKLRIWKSGKDMLLTRTYGKLVEQTVIKDYFVKNTGNYVSVTTSGLFITLSDGIRDITWEKSDKKLASANSSAWNVAELHQAVSAWSSVDSGVESVPVMAEQMETLPQMVMTDLYQ